MTRASVAALLVVLVAACGTSAHAARRATPSTTSTSSATTTTIPIVDTLPTDPPITAPPCPPHANQCAEVPDSLPESPLRGGANDARVCSAYRTMQEQFNATWIGTGGVLDGDAVNTLMEELNSQVLPYVTDSGLHLLLMRDLRAAEELAVNWSDANVGGLQVASSRVSEYCTNLGY